MENIPHLLIGINMELNLHLINCILKLIKPISRKQKLAIYCRYARTTAPGHSGSSKGISEILFPSFPTVPTPRMSPAVLRGAQSDRGRKCCAQGHPRCWPWSCHHEITQCHSSHRSLTPPGSAHTLAPKYLPERGQRVV